MTLSGAKLTVSGALFRLMTHLTFSECSITERHRESSSGRSGEQVARLPLSLYARLIRISDEHGATAAEYALFLATIAAVIAGAVTTIGINLNTVFTNFVAAF
jgi:Flp pilus assembly pilin Flp